jgi:precorrin-3B C17-methyltransferase
MSQLQSHDNPETGKLFIVGTGPGDANLMTGRARAALGEADIVIGNAFDLAQLDDLLDGKEVVYSSMGKEVDRARRCIELARTRRVAMVSGGDPGVYGMASIVLEVLENSNETIEVEVVPGVTAATAAASRLGSPLSGDYVTISLSDLLTPLEVITRRLDLAFRMGVPVAIYNPKSRGRPHNLAMALGIARAHLPAATPVGIVRNAFREGEEVIVTTLADLAGDDGCVDMHAIVIVGSEESKIWEENGNARGIITPRGYDRKYVY